MCTMSVPTATWTVTGRPRRQAAASRLRRRWRALPFSRNRPTAAPRPPEDRPAARAGPQDVGGEAPQGVTRELPGEAVEEGPDPRAAPRRPGEVVEGDLASAARERVGDDPRESDRPGGAATRAS